MATLLGRLLRDNQQQKLGPQHPETLISIYHLATLYSHQGQYFEAEKLHTEVLTGIERVLGRDHPDALVGKIIFA